MGNNSVIPSNDLIRDEREQIIEAIRSGCVDAFVIEDHDGQTIYTLNSADLPYSTLVQRMQQGAAMLNRNGEIIYANPSLAALFGNVSESLIGVRLIQFVHPEDRAAYQQLLDGVQLHPTEGQVRLRRFDESVLPTKVSFTTLSRDSSVIGVLVTDLTTEKSNAELASRIQSVQDEERRSIARELHDSVGQLLAAITMNLSALRKEATNLTPSLTAMLDDSNVMVGQVSKEIRTISHLLHPPLLDVAGLCSAIRWYVDGFAERSRIRIDLDMPTDIPRLSSDAEIAIFRVVQECLTNVYRHSGGDTCVVKLSHQNEQLRLEIRDNGRGMTKRSQGVVSSGVGLRGMQERLRQLGGTLEIDSCENGTSIIAMLPISEQDSQGAA
ncbi:MAG TPA: PAS domain-containing sensor histidine kinase [Candidatus Sulfotelmatobacter sp.]|nr:PAS domain-containing sensor histidine kinase [Candidatus Sulfotelmatobacter sp.]